MNETEFWDKVAGRIRLYWPHSQISKEALKLMYEEDLKDKPADQVLAALKALQLEGREHAPNGGHIIGKLVDLSTDTPEWGEVYRQLHSLVTLGLGGPYSDYGSTRQRVAARLDKTDEQVRSFVDQVGARQVYDDIGDGGSGQARLREKWKAALTRDKGDMALAGLPSAGLKRLERVNSAPKQIDASGVLKQLNQGDPK